MITTIYDVNDVYKALQGKVSKMSIYRNIETGKLKAIKVGKKYIISEKALNNFLEGNTEEC